MGKKDDIWIVMLHLRSFMTTLEIMQYVEFHSSPNKIHI